MIFLLPDEGTALTPLLRGEAALTDLFTDVYDNDEAQTAKLVWSCLLYTSRRRMSPGAPVR